MKKILYLILPLLTAFIAINGCKDETPKAVRFSEADYCLTAGYKGTVVETMNSGGYTYVQVDTGSEKIWAAAPECKVRVGDEVSLPQGLPMKDHHSRTLDRTFNLVYFVSAIQVGGAEQAADHPPMGHTGRASDRAGASIPAVIDFSGIEKPDGGKTVAELYAEKVDLVGKEVMVRGKVVKFSPEIMGKNWIHLQDGTGDKDTNDLTITTSDKARVGDTIMISGVFIMDKDYGYGYKYDVIIEDARVTVE